MYAGLKKYIMFIKPIKREGKLAKLQSSTANNRPVEDDVKARWPCTVGRPMGSEDKQHTRV